MAGLEGRALFWYSPWPRACAQIASDGLKGRVIQVNLADLQNVSACEDLLLLVQAPAAQGGGAEEGACLVAPAFAKCAGN